MSNAVMTRLTIRSVRVRWVRFALTALAVVVGVAAVTASFVLADTLRKTFNTLATSATENLDVLVRSPDPLGGDDPTTALRAPIPAAVVDEVAGIDGVARAEGNVQFLAAVTTPEGEAVKTTGAPILGFNWSPRQEGESDDVFHIEEGAGPIAPDETAIDQAAAKNYDLEIGDRITVRGVGGDGEFTITGLISFADGGAGAYYLLFEPATAQRLANIPGQFQGISVEAADGVNEVELRDRVAAALPDYEVLTGSQFSDEFSDSFGVIIDAIRTVLLVFAFVILFVAGFIINVVFNTTLGQRVRELALLRAIGARNRQVTRSVIGESLLIGVAASLLGALFGVGLAALARWAISSSGGGFPSTPLVLAGRTWLIALLVGVGVTLIVSVVPAWRAGRVAPVAALRDGGTLQGSSIRLRTILGGLVAAIGLVAFLYALFGSFDSTSGRLTLMGAGAFLLFMGVTALSPVVARPVATALSAPFVGAYGVTGRLAQGNAARNPRRTATTASALMIGVALVSMVGVLGSSFKASFSEQLEVGIAADYFLTPDNFVGFSPELAQQLDELPEVDQVTTFRGGQARIDGDAKSIQAVQSSGLDRIVNLDVREGTAADIPDDGVLVQDDAAADLGLGLGDTVQLQAPVGERELTITGLFHTAVSGSNWIISQTAFDSLYPPDAQLDAFGGVTLADGVDPAAGEAAVKKVTDEYTDVKVEDRAEFKQNQEDQINQLVRIIYILLALALFIAVLGIFITLMLAVFERTRELGLLRAVGQQRRQTRRMIRVEAIVVSLFGALLGVVMGVLFGLAISSAIPDSVMTTVAVPWWQIVFTFVAAGVAGVVAAIIPAWRGASLNVLEAISYE